MTLITIDLGDVAGGHHPDDHVIIRAENFREAVGGGITSTAEVKIPLVDGVGQAEVEPGPVVVSFRCQAVADTREKRGVVPASGTVGIEKVLENTFEYLPPVVNHALDTIKDAVAAEVDAIKWYRGIVPSGTASLSELSQGAWYVASSAMAQTLGLPIPRAGFLEIREYGAARRAIYTPLVLSSDSNQQAQTWTAATTSSGVWGPWALSSERWARPQLTITEDIYSLLPGVYPVAFASHAEILGLPVRAAGTLTVMPISDAGDRQMVYARGLSGVGEEWVISQQVGGGWGEWMRRGDLSASSSRHEILVSDLKARMGGRVVPGAAVALVIDHGTNKFNETYLPMLRARNLTCTIALNSQMYDTSQSRYVHDNRTSWEIVRGWAVNDGIEIANHGRTHRSTSDAEAFHEIVDGLTELKNHLPGIPIDTFVNHAGLTSGMADYDGGKVTSAFYNSLAGRLIHEYHACSVASATPKSFPLTGDPLVGVSRYWVETPALISVAKSAVMNAVQENQGVVLSLHPEIMDGDGKATDSEIEALLDWLAGLVTSGEVAVMTFREMMVAQAGETAALAVIQADSAAALAVAQADRATAARVATETAQLTAFAGALVQGSDPPAALPVGSIFVDVMTGIIYKK